MSTHSPFDLGFLRRRVLRPAAEITGGARLTRRGFLGLSGASLAAGAVHSLFHGDGFSLVREGNALRVMSGGTVRWMVDATRFDGNPKLSVDQKADTIRIAFEGVQFPGTSLPAGFVCELLRSLGQWTMKITFAMGGEVRAPWLKWLDGGSVAEGSFSPARIRPMADAVVSVAREARLQFTPDWVLRFRGETTVALRPLQSTLDAKKWELRLDQGESLLEGHNETPRTNLVFHRGDESWDVRLDRAAPEDGWRLAHAAENALFDELRLEAASAKASLDHAALLIQAAENATRLHFFPGGGLMDSGREPFHFKLRNARLAFTLSKEDSQSALLADFEPGTTWAHTEHLSLAFSPSEEDAPFELTDVQGQTSMPSAAPAVTVVQLPTNASTCTRLNFDEAKPLYFSWGGVMRPVERFLGYLHLLPWEHTLKIKLTDSDTLTVLRPSDMLVLDFQFVGVELHSGIAPKIHPAKTPEGASPWFKVIFPPQHVQEEAFYTTNDPSPENGHQFDPVAPVATMISPDTNPDSPRWAASGESTLAFDLGADFEPIPFHLDALLDWSKWTARVAEVAKSTQSLTHHAALPSSANDLASLTHLEIPYKVFLSPDEHSGWAHETKEPKLLGEGIELWHTRLGSRTQDGKSWRINEADDQHRTARAIYTYDKESGPTQLAKNQSPGHDPHLYPIDTRDRQELVHLTSDFSLIDRTGLAWIPQPLQFAHLMLSSQGAYLKGGGAWDPPALDSTDTDHTGMNLEKLNQVTTLGRDHYVRVVHKGYLAPFGHRASLVTISERVLARRAPGGPWIAVLHMRCFISVHNPTRTFPLPHQPNQGRNFPFKRVDVLTLQTPDLDAMKFNDSSMFWPMVQGAAFQFRFRFWSMESNVQAEASLPVVFITANNAESVTKAQLIANLYNAGNPLPGNTAKDSDRNSRDIAAKSTQSFLCTTFNDQPIAYGPPQKAGDTQFSTQYIRWQIEPVTDKPTAQLLYRNDLPYFFPFIDCAKVTSSAMQRVTGTPQPTWVTMFPSYLDSGFDAKANAGEVLLQVDTPNAPLLSFSSAKRTDQAGGFLSPDAQVVGFSRKAGPVGAKNGLSSKDVGINKPHASLTTFSSGKFDAADFFGAITSAKLLGVVKLGDIIAPLLGGVSSNLEKAPQMIEQALHEVGDALIKYEPYAVKAIDDFQSFRPEFNVIAPNMAPQARIVDTNFRAVQAAQAKADSSRSLDDDLSAALAHSALISSVASYVDQLSSLLNDPAALEEDLANDVINYLLGSDAWQNLQKQLTTLVGDLLNALAAVRAAIDTAVSDVLNKLNALLETEIDDPLPVRITGQDDISRKKRSLREMAPELIAVYNALQPAKDFAASIDAAKACLPKNPAGAVQLIPEMSEHLLSVCQALAPLGLNTSVVTDINNFIKKAQQAELDLRNAFFTVKQTEDEVDKAVEEFKTAVYHLSSLPGNEDGVGTLQSYRQLQRCLDRIGVYFKAFGDLKGTPSPQQVHRILQQYIRLQRELIVSIHALETAALTAMADAGHDIQNAGLDMLKAVNGIGSAVTSNKTLVEFISCFGAMSTALGAKTLTGTIDPLVQMSDSVRVLLQSQMTDLLTNINTDLDILAAKTSKVVFDADTQLQTNGASLQARLDAFNAVLPAQAAARLRVFDNTVRYIGMITTVVSWQSYVTLPAVPGLDSVKALLGAMNAGGAKVATAYAGILTATAAGGNKISDFIKQQKPTATNPGNLYLLFAEASKPLGEMKPPKAGATVSELIDDTRVQLAQLASFIAKTRDCVRNIGADLESVAHGQNLIPILLKDFPIPSKISLSYDWHPEIKSVEPIFLLESGADFVVKASFVTDLLGGAPPQTTVSATLKNFSVNLIGSPSFIILHVSSLVFTSTNGNKPDCRMSIDHVEFGQAMGFVAELAALLNPKTGPFVEFTGLGIRAGFRFALPLTTVGIFNVFQLAIEVAASLSFDGSPLRCQIGISDQNHPFLLSSGIYGGGGFLQLQLGLDGVQLLEGALEFGVTAAISIGPLEGYGYVMAGIYFRVGGEQAVVCGFLHAHGHMDIFGIISLDLDLYVSLCYMSNPNRVHGSADFSVSVHILFFSEEFHMHAEYDFIGSSAQSNGASSNEHASLETHQDPLLLADDGYEPDAGERWFTSEEWKEYQQTFEVCV